MKKLVALLFLSLLIISPAVAWAENSAGVLTGEQIEYIRNNCNDTQIALRRVDATDALAYVNLSHEYDTILTRLMAPMNSRVALNSLDSVALTRTVVDYKTQLAGFKAVYTKYEQLLNSTQDLNCYNQPVEFYDNVTSLLALRTQVRSAVDGLSDLVTQYRSQVVELQNKLIKGMK